MSASNYPLRRFDAIIFDLGSTLIYFDAYWDDILKSAVRELARELQAAGLQLDRQAFIRRFSAEMADYYRERDTEFIEYTTRYVLKNVLSEFGFSEIPEATLRRSLDAMYAVSQAHWQPEEDALPTLRVLKEQGYRMGLISNAADHNDVQTLVDKAGIRAYFDLILTSAGEGIRKPDPRIFRKMLDFLDVPPDRAAMVGDTLGADVLGARNAGMVSIWITRRADTAANQAHRDTIVPDAVIHSLDELPQVLANFNHRESYK